MMLRKAFGTLIAGTLAVSMLLTGCAGGAAPVKSTEAAKGTEAVKATEAAAPAAKEVKYPVKTLEMLAPAGAGGGWDQTIRGVAKTLTDTKMVTVAMPVTNKTGGGGGVALSYLQEKKGSDGSIAVYSAPLLLINLTGQTPLSYKDVTPLARLIADYEVFAVSKSSKYKSLKDVMDAIKKDPKSVKIGGNSAAGSLDHIAFLYVAKAAGVPVEQLKNIGYISFQDGSAPAQLMGGHIDLLTSGLGDIKGILQSGDAIGLAQTSDKRLQDPTYAKIPSCKEQGIDAVFSNWRGLFGPPSMPDYAVKFWNDTLKKMSDTPEWKALCVQNGWDIIYADNAEFEKFLEQTNKDYSDTLASIGMLKK